MKKVKSTLLLGTLISMTIILLLSINSVNVTADQGGGPPYMDWNYPPQSPKDGNYWDFNNNTIVGWRVTSSWFTQDLIYNITEMRLFLASENVTGTIPPLSQPYDAYGVKLSPMYWNTTTESIEEFPNLQPSMLCNVSLINYTNSYPNNKMLPFKLESEEFSHLLNLFIPKNSSGVLDIHWCADALHWLYTIFLTGVAPYWPWEYVNMRVEDQSIHYWNDTYGTYCDLYYSPNGILETGEMYGNFEGEFASINYTRLYDFNPLKSTKWTVDVGDKIYWGMERMELQVNINDIANKTFIDEENGFYMNIQLINSSIEMWNFSTNIWEPFYTDPEGGNSLIIGCANDYSPLVVGVGEFPILPGLLPIGADISKVAEALYMWGQHESAFDQYILDMNWIKVFNTSTNGYCEFTYNLTEGYLELLEQKNLNFLFDGEDTVIYAKNSTIINKGLHSFKIKTIGTAIFNVSLNISITTSTHLLYSSFDVNPINLPLKYGVLFIDVWVNNTENLGEELGGAVNITIEYDPKIYKDVEVWYFNTSSEDPNEAWKQLPYEVLGNGKILISVNHTSIFVFTNIPISQYLGDDDDDGDKVEKPAVPFGNYYLIFLTLAIIGLVIYKKRSI